MATVFTFVVLAFVVAVLLVVGFASYASIFGHHLDHYRDLVTGKRRWDPPNLEDGHY